MRSEALRVSPQVVDPFSWFTRPLVPVAFAIITLIYGLTVVIIEWQQQAHPLWDVLGVALIAASQVVAQARTGPFRGGFHTWHVVVIGTLCTLGLAASSIAAATSTVRVQYWWAPAGVALVIATIAPFCSVLRVLRFGATLAVLTCVAGILVFRDGDRGWPPLSSGVIATSTVVVGLIASVTFCYVVVSRTQAILEVGRFAADDSQDAQLEAMNRVERQTVARLGTRVAPFLERVADAGVVTNEDRALAGQLARRLRSDLVEQANRSWLDNVADRGRIFVVDPDHSADRMNAAQRTALRGLLVAALRTPGTDASSLFIELRPQDDGSTAVALSLDVDLPEGRRAMMLAPYYLALQTTVSDMTYDSSRELLRFELRD